MSHLNVTRLCGLAAIAVAAVAAFQTIAPPPASAQMMNSYQFQARDRASIAFGMRNVENPPRASSSSTGAAGVGIPGGGTGDFSGTMLVCGGDAGGASVSTSKANASCLILNNVTGDFSMGQTSSGDQNSNASSQSSSTQTTNQTQNNMSEALEQMAVQQ